MRDSILMKLIAIDIWVMRTFLGGLEGETISAAAWNARLTGRWWFGVPGVILIDLLFFIWERDHCRKAWEWQQHLYNHTRAS